MSVPPRTISAPIGSKAFSAAYGGAPTLSRDPNRVTLPPATGAFKAKVSVAPAASVDAPAPSSPSPAPTPAPPVPEVPSTTNAVTTSGGVKSLADIAPLWADAMQKSTDQAGPDVMAWAKSMWEAFASRDAVDRPDHLFGVRDASIFGGLPAGATKRHILVKERTLPHLVMGILSRVTPDNYEAIEQELMMLPIRQSEDSEIAEVVNVFFKKAIRPEDSIYAPQYAKLIGALVKRIEEIEKEKDSERGVSKVIRGAIIAKCKEQYDNLPELRELQTQAKADMDNPETEMRRRELMAKLKANIGFLGQLFVNRLIVERVVVSVLYNLLWDRQRNDPDSVAQDYEIEQFSTLLEVCGPRLTQASRDAYQESYINQLNSVATFSNASNRTKVLALNCKEFIENGYEKKRGKKAGPMKLEEYNRQAAEQQVRDLEMVSKAIKQQQAQNAAANAANPPPHSAHPRSALRKNPASPTGQGPAYTSIVGRNGNTGGLNLVPGGQPQPPVVAQPQPIMNQVAFNKLIDTLTTNFQGVVAFVPDLASIPAETLLEYFVTAFSRYSGKKSAENRKAVGPILRAARDNGLITTPHITTFVKQMTANILLEDSPSVFESFCEILDSAPDIFGFPAFNAVLRSAFATTPSCSFKVLKSVIKAVSKRSPENISATDNKKEVPSTTPKLTTPVAAGCDFPSYTATRVHILPHLLRFVGYTSNNPGADGFVEEDDPDLVSEREEFEVLEIIISETRDAAAARESSNTSAVRDPTAENGDIALATYAHLSVTCQVTDVIDYQNCTSKDEKERVRGLLIEGLKPKSLNNIWIARKVLSAVFIFARLNSKLMKELIGTLCKTVFETMSMNNSRTLLLEIYETWIELDRKPATALDTCYETILAHSSATFGSSTAVDSLLAEIKRNGDDRAIPNVLKLLKRN